MLKASTWLKLLLMLLMCNIATAQNNAMVDSIIKHTAYYRVKESAALMFVHLDKTVYVNNEMMWFSAYLLNVPDKEIPKHEVLSAALVSSNDQKVVIHGQFVMQMGFGYGNLTVPDTVPPGHYHFIAYTNRTVAGKPEIGFVQPVTIKTASESAFHVELTLDTLYKDPVNTRVILKVTTKNGPLDGAAINYYLGAKKLRVDGKGKTNVIGSYTLLLPKDHIIPSQHNLEVQVKSGKEVKVLHLDIPVKKRVTDVKFYPEGGYLIAGLANKVGWEVKTPGGAPIKTEGILYAGNQLLGEIHTDSYGMGTFNMVPKENVNYTVKLSDDMVPDTTYTLPAALPQGMIMRISNALADDVLPVQIQSNYPGKIYLMVHNYRQVFSFAEFNSVQQGRAVKIDLTTIPRGINTLTFLDSVKRPIAERLFFAHYNKKPTLTIATDNATPGLRQKVHVRLKLNSAVNGVVSVACAQDNRFEVKNDNNIEHYVYLQSQIDNLPVKDKLLGSASIDYQYLNELLLVRGWSRYKWPELIKATPEDTLKKYDSLLFTGNIKHFDLPIKKPVSLAMFYDSPGTNTFNSTADGNFTLTNDDLYTPYAKKIRVVVTGSSSEYSIKITNPYLEINKAMAKDVEPLLFDAPITQNTKEFLMTGFEHATHLKEVKIIGRPDGFIHANGCGDYVCRYHVLNCPNHRFEPDNRPPITGEMVYVHGLGREAYGGCTNTVLPMGMNEFVGIYTAKEFYGADYATINPPEPDYLSTIYWKNRVVLKAGKEMDISFYTSDITGKFRIVAQGVTDKDVVYGEAYFTVVKK